MPFPNPPKAVVFDMDGVLFDTEAVFRRSLKSVAAEMGHAIPDDIAKSMIGVERSASQAMIRQATGGTLDVHALWNRANERVHAEAVKGELLKPGVFELLEHLESAGVPTAIATSSFRDQVDRNLEGHGLTGRFDFIVANGDYARAKPEPDPYLMAAEKLGFEPAECLAVEDSYNGVRSAARAGMMTVMVPDILPANDEMRSLVVAVADDLGEVEAMLKRA
ncbi:MAG: HAD family phosphatase [Ancalomicrobiaceae bacterium]|nr:HAD family phosphatase [Ancalomicrobiaceae bacterium]